MWVGELVGGSVAKGVLNCIYTVTCTMGTDIKVVNQHLSLSHLSVITVQLLISARDEGSDVPK